ncbi:hypothetical protein LINGRAHAP2_LOCUS19985 [Linum grandiflorum]
MSRYHHGLLPPARRPRCHFGVLNPNGFYILMDDDFVDPFLFSTKSY